MQERGAARSFISKQPILTDIVLTGCEEDST
jgi:hypothetical protein